MLCTVCTVCRIFLYVLFEISYLVLRLPLKLSEKTQSIQTLLDNSMVDNADFRPCNRLCNTGQKEVRMVAKTFVEVHPKVRTLFCECFKPNTCYVCCVQSVLYIEHYYKPGNQLACCVESVLCVQCFYDPKICCILSVLCVECFFKLVFGLKHCLDGFTIFVHFSTCS